VLTYVTRTSSFLEYLSILDSRVGSAQYGLFPKIILFEVCKSKHTWNYSLMSMLCSTVYPMRRFVLLRQYLEVTESCKIMRLFHTVSMLPPTSPTSHYPMSTFPSISWVLYSSKSHATQRMRQHSYQHRSTHLPG
jgi:hypothetical protein